MRHSDTPRTNAAENEAYDVHIRTRSEAPDEGWDFARGLELEIADLQSKVEHGKYWHDLAQERITKVVSLEGKLHRCLQALYGLAQPLGRMDYTVAQLDAIVRKIAEEAIAEAKKSP